MQIKLAIILPDSLPVPAVRGGAVQTGVQQIVDENEKFKLLDLTVFSIYDNDAEKLAKKYNYTSFCFIQGSNESKRLMMKTVNKMIKLFTSKISFDIDPSYTKKLASNLSKQSFDSIIIKNSVRFVEPISKIADSFIWLQLQNDHLNHNTYRSEIIYALCHKVLVNSTYIKNRVLTIKNAKPENISVHRNCTDISMFDKNRFSADVILKIKKRFGINDGEVVILYCGRIVSEKGIRELIMAVRKLPRNLKIKLLIVGSKNFDKKVFNFFLHSLKKLSKEISDKIVFTGFIPYKELPEVYAVSDIAVVPSIWEEPAGRVIIEAQASGLPLIASGSGGMLDYICKDSTIVVKRGKNFIDNLSFEINRLVNDSVLRNTMGRAGYEFAKNFDSHKYYEQLIKLLRRDNR